MKKHNLENIPACLRIIARQIEHGEIEADVGLLSLRKAGSKYPMVFGFGTPGKHDHVAECGRAAVEILRLAGVKPASRDTVTRTIEAIEKVVSE